jgi:hypothetical protein
MIKFGFKNTRLLSSLSNIRILKHFFVLKITKEIIKISDERILNKFYKDIYVQTKTSKKTEKNRFRDLDESTLKYLIFQENYLHDIAVSNGITSYDLLNKLTDKKIVHELYISDYFSKIYVKTGFITKVYDSKHNFFFGYLLLFFAADRNIFFPFTVLLFKILKQIKNSKQYDFELLLFHPEILKKIQEKRIIYIDYNVFNTKIENKFTFIRCMNILNKGYFSAPKIIEAMHLIEISLVENRILLVGRTNAKKNIYYGLSAYQS